ncbi:DUF1852 domain-containing protein [Alteromonas sp. D210916BOD_24]|uniref:DUF1852 domain-containing protein n=1 Tax=Alteromonas sp. D210916BOD_24 TaxID=3157618 RepID=UPI00399C7125
MTNNDISFSINRIRFDEHYEPSNHTRITTNFANLARGEKRQDNLRNALKMMDNRFNTLAHWDNPNADRYSLELDIISVEIDVEGNGQSFPNIEVLQTTIVDRATQKRTEGIVGNNFSSYVRDYDFSVVLNEYNKYQNKFSVPTDFGELHGNLFKLFINSAAYTQQFSKKPVICLSVSDNKTYCRTENIHPVLGVEYLPNDTSLTEQYFKKMGLNVRYFMPPYSVAPFAFYFIGDLLNDYTNLELVSTVSTMETFQKIYRPEIYNANAVAGKCFKPNLNNPDHSITQIEYDRNERTQLAIEQGRFVEEQFIKPYRSQLAQWSATCSL